MSTSFHVFFVIVSVLLLNREGSCTNRVCKDILNNSVTLELKDHLFCAYDTDVKPTGNILVQFGLYIRQFDVDELSSMVSFDVWIRMLWTDPLLSWNPTVFDGITSLHVMNYEIWVPDVTIHSATIMDVDIEMPKVECWVNHTGNIVCVPSMSYTTSCESDYTWWPYDMMNCTIHIASWAHSTNEIDLRFADFNEEGQLIVDLSEHLQWSVVEVSHSERLIDSKFGLGFISKYLSYHVLLKRHSSMYSTIYITMAIVLMTMTLMTLWLEPKSTERIILANLNFVLHFCSVQEIQWMLPHTGARPPELLLFYEKSLILATLALILTSVLRHMQELTAEAPGWLSSVTVTILKSRVGQVFLASILDPRASARIETNVDDNAQLVSFDKQKTTWRYTSILIGWLAFIGVFLVYVIMLIVSLPTDRSAAILSARN
ncbi:Neuronal acetylcholine receptor subunit alpha-5 [Anthophora plagiata]